MNKLVCGIALLLLLSSCDQVVFPEPQPGKVKALDEIPELLQGLYIDQNKDSLYVYKNSFSYAEGPPLCYKNEPLSDSTVLKVYRGKYFFNRRIRIKNEYYWLTYMLDPVDLGKRIDLYAMDPGDIVKLAKLQEITSKLRDIENGDNNYYLFAPKKKHYKEIISDTIFTKMISFNKLAD
ncbi:MAG: hypothetical protein ABFS05_03980 [Bacteroidota bacterium]